jgi:hypothetical protein
LVGSHVFPKHLKGPIKCIVGSPRLHLFIEEKNLTISNSRKWKFVKNKNDLTSQKSNKKRVKMIEASQKITKIN